MPGLERLGELIEEVRAAGLPVELSIDGVRRPLDAGVELSAYRIVQEALTNALKHARGARPRSASRTRSRRLEIEVTDRGGSGGRDLGDPGARRARPDRDARARRPLRRRLRGRPDADGFRVPACRPPVIATRGGRGMTADPGHPGRRPGARPDGVPDDPRGRAATSRSSARPRTARSGSRRRGASTPMSS